MAATDSNKIYFDEFHRYHSGEMSHQEQHEFETRLLDEPMFADAYEGYLSMIEDRVDVESAVANLNQQLENRIGVKKTRLIPIWSYATAASVVLAVSALLYTTYEQKQVANLAMDKIVAPGGKAKESLADNTIAATVSPNQADSLKTNEAKGLLSKPVKINSNVPASIDNKVDRVAANESITEIKGADSGLPHVVPSLSQSAIDEESAPQHLPRPAAAPALASQGLSRAKMGASDGKSANDVSLVQGQVVDANGKGLPGVIIRQSKNQGVTTDSNGHFSLNVSTADSLRITYIGYKNKEIAVERANLGVIKLDEDIQALSEVAVSGYGRQSKKQSAASISSYSVGNSKAAPKIGWEKYDIYLRQKTNGKEKGSVKVTFKVNGDGSLSDFSAKGVEVLREPAVRSIQNGPEWSPAVKNNFKVEDSVTVTVFFED